MFILTWLMAEMYHAKQNIQYVFFQNLLRSKRQHVWIINLWYLLLVFLDIPFEILKYLNSVYRKYIACTCKSEYHFCWILRPVYNTHNCVNTDCTRKSCGLFKSAEGEAKSFCRREELYIFSKTVSKNTSIKK